MTRYRLPRNLGAHEVEIISGPLQGEVTVYPLGFPRNTRIELLFADLEEIPPPPLPAEPPFMRIVLVFKSGDEHGTLYRRHEDGWCLVGHVELLPLTWAELCSMGEVVVLGPDFFWSIGQAFKSADFGRYAQKRAGLRAERASR